MVTCYSWCVSTHHRTKQVILQLSGAIENPDKYRFVASVNNGT